MAMLPLIGGAMGLAGIAGAYGSGAMAPGQRVSVAGPEAGAYQYGGSEAAAQAWRDELAKRQQGWQPQLASDIAAQQRALGRFEDMAAGKGPSLAREQLAAGQAEAQRRQAAMAAGASGGAAGRALAERNAQRVGADAALEANQAAAALRAQEQIGAMNAAANLATGMRGASQQGEQASMGDRLGMEGAQMQGQMQRDQNRMRNDQWTAEQNARIEEANKQKKAALWGGLASAGAGLMGMGLSGGSGGGK